MRALPFVCLVACGSADVGPDAAPCFDNLCAAPSPNAAALGEWEFTLVPSTPSDCAHEIYVQVCVREDGTAEVRVDGETVATTAGSGQSRRYGLSSVVVAGHLLCGLEWEQAGIGDTIYAFGGALVAQCDCGQQSYGIDRPLSHSLGCPSF